MPEIVELLIVEVPALLNTPPPVLETALLLLMRRVEAAVKTVLSSVPLPPLK